MLDRPCWLGRPLEKALPHSIHHHPSTRTGSTPPQPESTRPPPGAAGPTPPGASGPAVSVERPPETPKPEAPVARSAFGVNSAAWDRRPWSLRMERHWKSKACQRGRQVVAQGQCSKQTTNYTDTTSNTYMKTISENCMVGKYL